MNWQEEQAAFWRWIVASSHPSKSEERMDSDKRMGIDEAAVAGETQTIDRLKAVDKLMAPHPQLSSQDALGIYQNAYWGRLLQTAAELYPITYYTLGEAAHQQLWVAYLSTHPPKPGPMSQLGKDLPQYCEQHAPYRDLPALLELVALETRLVELFECADQSRYTRQDLQNNSPEQWATMSWVTTEDWTVMPVHFDLATYWLKMQSYREQDGATPGAADFAVPRFEDNQPHSLLIRRQHHKMHFQQISSTFAEFIAGIKRGDNFAKLCDTLSQHYPAEAVPAKSLNYLLQAIDLELLHQQRIKA